MVLTSRKEVRMDGSTFVGGVVLGGVAWFLLKYVIGGLIQTGTAATGLRGFYTVNQNERAVKTVFGRAERTVSIEALQYSSSLALRDSERERYQFPTVKVIPPGGPYFAWPWERVYKVSIATQTLNMAFDPELRSANQGGTVLEAVTKDQLNTGLSGQIRFRVSEQNLYAYLFGVKRPQAHVMGFFVSILRQRIASFVAPARARPPEAIEAAIKSPLDASSVAGISINDLRKNLRDLNEQMEEDCRAAVGRYGIAFDASLITGIDPPVEVESALAAINTAHNQVSADISLAQATADQRIVQSRRAVEVETLKAQAEVEPLTAMAEQLTALRQSGSGALKSYLRNVRLGLYTKAKGVILGVKS
jgi:regulator of protease activity HflC (stomatin/prohibitin superfamily)